MTDATATLSIGLDQPNRYRLYAFKACPFAHRVRLLRLLAAEDAMEVSFAKDQNADDKMYVFDPPEPVFSATTLKQVYQQSAAPDYSGRFSTPLVIDQTTKQMVHNESLDIAVAMAQSDNSKTLLPEGATDLAQELANITMLPYKYLMTKDATQKQDIVDQLEATLDKYESLLGTQPYLLGEHISLPDCILWITLIRFDNVYGRIFGILSSSKTIQSDYPNLTKYVERIWKTPSQSSKTTLGDEIDMPELVRLYWVSPTIGALCSHDQSLPPPPVLDLF
ncbi:Glutathione S-transferase [Seminavis robusta]|uniref:Glutathione S-transferase n=1 Tax=Seminavis robusta TaxID=568900 RepID=A0A9N8DQ93_9STRA|nr:Glutathione S-transferase [Seminavis robusta]|eukprot:Sro269_g104010.1 Glutathione S-transferase (279) ;mRNA; f:40714-41550